MKIQNIHAQEILDSNGNPTILTEIELWSGDKGRASVPSGASTGKTEVLELRDNDEGRYQGKGVLKAVDIVNNHIAPLVKDKEFTSQREFDELLINTDGTELKTKLGGNCILSCSMAFCRAVANSFGIPLYQYIGMIYWGEKYTEDKFKLPVPLLLVLEGGKHGNWATDIQEYMIIPNKERFPTMEKQLEEGISVYKSIEKILDEKKYSVGVGFEGAFAPKEITSNQEAFDIIIEGIKRAGFKEGEDFTMAIDAASSEFFNEQTGFYELKREQKNLSAEDWMSLQLKWYSQYPIYSIEDPFNQDDWGSWKSITEKIGTEKLIVGDDLLTTNTKRIKKGIEEKAMNTVLIKLNQIGTVTETIDAIQLAKENNIKSIISHRSGETTDDFIADLVVGTASEYSKFGGATRGERVVKYNRLLEIEREINKYIK